MVYDLGKIIPRPRGEYAGGVLYDALDFVYHQGSSYICKQDGTKNKVPTNTQYWQPMAAKGEQTTQLTPEQMAEIVQSVIDQGVVVDTGYAQFKSTTEEAIQQQEDPGNGTITIKRNGTNVGSFSTNQSTNSNINIQVPTRLSDLSDYNSYKAMDPGETVIGKAEPGMTYEYLDAITSLEISEFISIADGGSQMPARVIFQSGGDFAPVFGQCYICDLSDYTQNSNQFTPGGVYMLEIIGQYMTIRKYESNS